MAQMLAIVVNERQDDWDLHLPHDEFAYNTSVSASTGLAPNEVHTGRRPRLPLAGFDRTGVVGYQSLARDHLAYCDLATDREKRANDIARAHHALTVSRDIPLRYGRLGMGVQLCLHHPPGCEGEHGHQGTQGQTRA